MNHGDPKPSYYNPPETNFKYEIKSVNPIKDVKFPCDISGCENNSDLLFSVGESAYPVTMIDVAVCKDCEKLAFDYAVDLLESDREDVENI